MENSNNYSLKNTTFLSKGGYGSVYSAIIGTPISKNSVVCEKTVAIKYIEYSKNKGVESLIETYIVRCLKHKNLIHALLVEIEPIGRVKIMLPLAQCDTATIIRKKLLKPKESTLKKWFWQIVTAVAYLHSNGIIHGDIKGGNILAFGPDIPKVHNEYTEDILDQCDVKLADFSLSVLVSDPIKGTRDIMRSVSYTSTHRPLEVWRSDQWSYSADIWALGCTFFELKYAIHLFPDQKQYKNEMEAMSKCHEDFSRRNLNIPPSPETSSVSKNIPIQSESSHRVSLSYHKEYNINNIYSTSAPHIHYKNYDDFKPCNIPNIWFNKSNRDINDLILSTVVINPYERLSIWEIIEHSYFCDVYDEDDLPNIENRSYPYISFGIEGVSSKIIKEIEEFSSDTTLNSLALSLYLRSHNNEEIINKKPPSIKTCVLVAHKLLFKVAPSIMGKITNITRDEEILLCEKLNFFLLPHVEKNKNSPMLFSFNNI